MKLLPTLIAATLLCAPFGPALAQAAKPAPAAPAPSAAAAPAPAAKAKKPPSAGQTAMRERQKTCGAQWKADKAAGKTTGQTWPKYWSACNKRLKAGNA